jgi:hypothetical protein
LLKPEAELPIEEVFLRGFPGANMFKGRAGTRPMEFWGGS